MSDKPPLTARERQIDRAVRIMLARPENEIVFYGGEPGDEIGFLYVHKGPIDDVRRIFRALEERHGGKAE